MRFPWLLVTLTSLTAWAAEAPPQRSGIYPSLAYFNDEGECGTGAVVPWADRLWVITYGPHKPYGSSDKLYEITPDRRQIVRPESVGGTPANRMLHPESNQLIIGPYFIDADRNVRVIPPKLMPGRLTGNARHLTDPKNKIYFATMEDGLYEVDVRTLAVTGLIKEKKNKPLPGQVAEVSPAQITTTLPGYHGKGLYSGQGLVVLANNGEDSGEALKNPAMTSGALGSFNGSGNWSLIRRNQFTEVTGPGGLSGNAQPATDPIWSVGWDFRSLILMVLSEGKWTSYRLPKASHAYDGAHGWNTEWPRIRDIGEADQRLMTMHGSFWKFPARFSPQNSAGIIPRTNYLKVIGDFTRWQEQLVFGCDDTAKSEFLNKRPAKGALAGPGQSQSNLWFTSLATPDLLGPALGRGSVWMQEAVAAGVPSDPFLLDGFAKRLLVLQHDETAATTFTLEVDRAGNGQWTTWQKIELAAQGGAAWIDLSPAVITGAWLRVTSSRAQAKASASFQYANDDPRLATCDALFGGISPATAASSQGAFLLTRGGNLRTLSVLPAEVTATKTTTSVAYELTAELKLVKVADSKVTEFVTKNTPIPAGVVTADPASVIFEEDGQRWRLPRAFPTGDARNTAQDKLLARSALRKAREVCTERDLLQAHGTFYELPALNALGAIRLRPVATSELAIHDYCSYRGLLVLAGLQAGAVNPEHIIRSGDGQAAVWAGGADDLWKLGKPRGFGGPWLQTTVAEGTPSDPYLMTGYDEKNLTLQNHGAKAVRVAVLLDVTGDGKTVAYRTFEVPAGGEVKHTFARHLNAYWIRFVADSAAVLSAQLEYK